LLSKFIYHIVVTAKPEQQVHNVSHCGSMQQYVNRILQ